MSTNETAVIRDMLALSDEALLALENAIVREKAARHQCSGGTRFPELRPVVIVCAPGRDDPDVRSHVREAWCPADQADTDPAAVPGTAAHRDRVAAAIRAASAAGRAAFERGAMAVPRCDPALMQLLRENADDPGISIPLLDAWSRAWHAANIEAPVPEVQNAG
jgi:hypothetical protein